MERTKPVWNSRKLTSKARVIEFLLRLFISLYEGVPEYWSRLCWLRLPFEVLPGVSPRL